MEDVGIYDISSDGERFHMVRGYVEDAEGEDFTGFGIVQNWFEELTRAPDAELKAQILWLRVFVEGVVIVGRAAR